MGDVRFTNERVMMQFEFQVPDGLVVRRVTWAMVQSEKWKAWTDAFKSPPDWLMNPSRAWPDPQGPIYFRGRIIPGKEHILAEYISLFDRVEWDVPHNTDPDPIITQNIKIEDPHGFLENVRRPNRAERRGTPTSRDYPPRRT